MMKDAHLPLNQITSLRFAYAEYVFFTETKKQH